tara:strand:- start:106 stop:660 length:555 start_codon:yes stop_codon:yes gene_type:complete
MNKQNLLIYEFENLYIILNELKSSFNFNIQSVSKNDFQNLKFDNYLVLCQKKNKAIKNQIVFENFPIKITKLLEKINIEFLKKKFNEQSNINVGNYMIDINSRELILEKSKLRLTEKEINTILYLANKRDSVSISDLQTNVWSYQAELETHTVETHIHRLRKKIKNKFNDENLIISTKNGYQIV